MAEVAAVGWAISTLGWIVSPITTKLLNHGFELLGFDESEKLRDLEERLLPRLELMRQQAERIPPEQRGRVEQWAKRLKSAFYDAEDILDVADYHRLEKQVMSQSGTKSAITINSVKQITSGRNRKLKNVLKKLENIIEEGSQLLSLLASTITVGSSGNDMSDPTNRATRITTTSSPTGSIIGRDKDRDEIIRMLHETASVCEPTSSNSKCYSVIGVYGIAGSGKTTIAQHVCTFERTENYFSPIMWVHVNEIFNVHGIYRQMLEAALGEPCHEFSNLDTLQMKLEAALRGKRFLLVLDDVWTGKDVNDECKLDQLCSPLKAGDTGSKVLVTTRFADAAKYLGCHSPMQIPDLNETEFFNLFMHYALDDANLGDQESETFKMIGGQIAKKLKRSPLAARVVGSRLRKQLKAIIWRRVEDHGLLTDTMGALWWSYQYLDEHVRRCFAYCSIFPQGHVFKRAELVDLWMTEGFIKSTGTVEQMEDIAQGYFDELVSCSFLQTRKYSDDTSENEWVTTHDLLLELATMVAGNDCTRVDANEIKQFPPDARHLFVRLYDPIKFTEQICKLENLRTLIITSSFTHEPVITIEELEGMLKKLKKLRVVQVPLQGKMTLELRDEGFLEFSNVKNMSSMISLRHIKNSQHYLFDFSKISSFPGVGEMKSLQELSDFRVRKEKGYELQQLERLNHLCGSLRISGLENVESKERALEAKLSDKKYLTTLSLAWSRSSSQQPDLEAEISEGLCPPSQLTELRIYGYSGWKYPSWLAQKLSSIRCLELDNCVNLETLPDISEHFIHLEKLRLVSLWKLKKLPRLPDSLKRLDVQICEALVETCGRCEPDEVTFQRTSVSN
ncbi:hypothetical protein BDA96_09G044000 [Sorghum bicolor]|uniref:NB-ARC domain-containing protein n=1 Tax=Sorghum bicolor TaxID=4558 RepID=A0A921Q874_SORBI|nr:hypothetical protein BDA96_09G044000 [Sorghum bicolor]